MVQSWIDIHCHLNFLEVTPEEALKQAREAGVERLITIGTEAADHAIVQDLAQRLAPHVFFTIGVHPHEAKHLNEALIADMRRRYSDPRCVAVGEIGLDYYYNNSSKEEQLAAFRSQMDLASEFGLPVQIHTRDADEDTVTILKEYEGRVRGVIHCFTDTLWLAEECLKLGYNISFSGILTFKNADALREVALTVPLDRMHVETDAPFLAPVPMRGRKNVPAFVVHTAQYMANLKGVALDDLLKQTTENAYTMFSRLS